MKRILLIKLRYLGDVVLSTPILSSLRRQFPKARITFLVNAGTEEILHGNSHVDDVWVVPRDSLIQQSQLIMKLRRAGFDAVLDLTDGDRSAFLSWVTGAPVRLGFNRDRLWRGKFYSQTIRSAYGSMHMVEYHAQILRALGISESVGDPEMAVNADAERFVQQLLDSRGLQSSSLILLYPSARYVFKTWPLERFAALANWFAQKGFQVALVGDQREASLGQQIMNMTAHKPVNLMGHTNLSTLSSLMKQSVLVVGNDGGPLHIAAAVGCRVIGLFGPTDPAVWGPRGSNVHVIYKGLDCRECFYPGCSRGEESCMRQISLEEVCHAAQSFLRIFKT